MTATPTSVFVETPRLRLRAWQDEDAPVLHQRIFGDPEVMVFSLGGLSLDQTSAWIDKKKADQAEHGFSHWAVEDRAGGELLGLCGFALQQLPEGRFPEAGYRLARAHWGRGLATEAVRGVLEWAWERTDFPTAIAIIHPENRRSARVAEKAGMRIAWETRWYGMRHQIYAVERPQGEAC